MGEVSPRFAKLILILLIVAMLYAVFYSCGTPAPVWAPRYARVVSSIRQHFRALGQWPKSEAELSDLVRLRREVAVPMRFERLHVAPDGAKASFRIEFGARYRVVQLSQ